MAHSPAWNLDLNPDADTLSRMQRARDAFLSDGTASPELRPEIVHSWRRSVAHGVDYRTMTLPGTSVTGRSERLRRAAEPVMERLGSQLQGARAWAMLLDRHCAQIGPAVGDENVRAVTVGRGSRPGAIFQESRVGTNGAGTAAERLEPFVVVGPEHFRDSERTIVSVGAPVRDALNRIAGIVALNCRLEYSNSILVPFARDVAWAIGHRLAEEAQGVERQLFAHFSTATRRPSQAAIAVGDDVLIANTAARQLTVHGISVETVAERALESARAAQTDEFEIVAGDERLEVRATRVSLIDGGIGAIALFGRPGARRSDTAPGSPTMRAHDPVDMLRRARQANVPAMIVGERGAGKNRLAAAALQGAGGGVTRHDARTAAADETAWAARLRADAESHPVVVISHLDDLPTPMRDEVASIMDAVGSWFLATTTTAVATDAASSLDDRFAVVVHRTPLRERQDELPGIVEGILAEVRIGGRTLRCSPSVLAVLSRQRWPGNISQLRRILATAAAASSTGEITLDDIPAGALVDERARDLTKLERLERELVLTSLREASWNREEAARALGISRATMYRKLKQFGISVPSSRT